MAKVQVGDKVRFLNTTGGGIVKALQGKNMALVEDDSGFDVPVLISECVVVGSSDNAAKFQVRGVGFEVQGSKFKVQDSKFGVQEGASVGQGTQPQVQHPPLTAKVAVKETPEGEYLNAILAFVPVDPKSMMQSAYEAWFINDSNYFLYFTCLSCQNNSWTCRYHGLIEPHTKVFMEEFGKEALNEWEHICMQMLAFKQDKPFRLKNALSVELRLDTVKFYKMHCFTENDFFDEVALLFPVVQHDIAERQLLVSATELQEAMMHTKQDLRQKPQPAVSKSSKKEHPIIEIDLHINQLLDSAQGMSAGEILNYQMSRFHEVLKENAGKKGQKIVFIHGKGEGVLRTAIEKELKTRYKKYAFQDASFKEYGFGATMVKIV